MSLKVVLALCFLVNGEIFGRLVDDDERDIENEISNPFELALEKHDINYDAGLVPVRPGVQMFWWLFYADGKRTDAEKKPMILWVQGGPGLAASGIGNFMEIGPLDMDIKYRNHTWMKDHNLLLIDSPAGTGFSTVDNNSKLARKDKNIVTDLVQTLVGFLKEHPEFQKVPWHIFSQSYGGKLAPKLAYRIFKAKAKGLLEMDLRTVGIGSGFNDPAESFDASLHFMFLMGLVDLNDYLKLKERTAEITDLIKRNSYYEAFLNNMHKFDQLDKNVVKLNKNNYNRPVDDFDRLESIMNEYVSPVLARILGAERQWRYMSGNVYMSLGSDMFLPSTKYVEKVLNETSIRVLVYNGNQDAVTPMAGCVNWVHKLRWHGKKEFADQARSHIPGQNSSYYKEYDSLSLWWVNGAGHWVPNDNPTAMKQILEYATSRN